MIGKPYTDSKGKYHKWGHMSIRVINSEYDKVFDFGRYRRERGLFNQYGEGILNVRDGNKFVESENQQRETISFRIKTSKETDDNMVNFFEDLILDEGVEFLYFIDQETGKRYKLSKERDYHYKNNNCVTISIEALKSVGIDIYNEGTYLPLDALEQSKSKDKEDDDFFEGWGAEHGSPPR